MFFFIAHFDLVKWRPLRSQHEILVDPCVNIALAQKHLIQNTTWEYNFLHCLDHTSQNDISTYSNSTTTTTTTQVKWWKPSSNPFERCVCSHDWVKRFSFFCLDPRATEMTLRTMDFETKKTGKKWHHCHHAAGDTKIMSINQPTPLS